MVNGGDDVQYRGFENTNDAYTGPIQQTDVIIAPNQINQINNEPQQQQQPIQPDIISSNNNIPNTNDINASLMDSNQNNYDVFTPPGGQ